MFTCTYDPKTCIFSYKSFEAEAEGGGGRGAVRRM